MTRQRRAAEGGRKSDHWQPFRVGKSGPTRDRRRNPFPAQLAPARKHRRREESGRWV